MAGKRVLLCDDDALVRGVVRRLMEDAGYEVVAEADSPENAMAAMGVGGIDVVVLDLALRSGHGEHVLARIQEQHPGAQVVIFSAYVADPNELFNSGAAAVVEKPHFDRLEAVILGLVGQSEVADRERRRTPTRALTPMPEPVGHTTSGLEQWESFLAATGASSAGDVIVAFDLLPNAAMRAVWDHVYRFDYRLTLARTVVTSSRPHDRTSIAPGGLPVSLVVGGHADAPAAFFERIERQWRREMAVGFPVGAYGLVGDETDADKLLNTVLAGVASQGDHVQQPLRMV